MSASEETLQGFSDHFVINCCGAAAAALLVFDYVLTFEQEVNFIWSSTNYVYVLLFLANRLAMLGMTVGSVLNMLPWYSILYANIEATFFPVPSYAYCYGQTEYTVVLANSLYNVARVSVKSTLATYLLRDGTFYFLVLLVLNICQVITDFDRGVFYNPLPYFSNPYVTPH
ncbi:hypothetical protein EVJ58_g4000 [Rhodofomes roseus]|uniref:DUF6533 domain-containing protein n=1 Tax=Rhodofomes roseus TaxID=34475 RepID=A0A4Y9YKA3_9APHY|nr:hypothetical protein EVJ58_g4000 [Rhodofomes roseus]